jgi:hypothetical protein
MPWTARITLDGDKPDVGTATATWNAGEPDEFSYSCRVKVSMTEGKAFAREANAAHTKAAAKTAREGSLAKILTDLLTAEEAAS